MERNGRMLRALFAGIEPIIIGLVTGRQWLVLLGLCNIFIILLRNTNENSQTKQSPLSHNMFSYKSHIQNLRTQNNYFGAISFVAIIIGIVTYVLETGDQYAKIALALMATGLAYRIIAAATHGFRNTWAQVISKIFAALVILSTGWAYLGSSAGQAFFAELPSKFMDMITIPTAMAPIGGSNVKLVNTMGTGSTATGEQKAATGTTTPVQEPQQQPTEQTTKNNTTALTFAQVVPVLVKKFNLNVPSGSIKFTNISSDSAIYNDFKAGYAARFFGPSINPSSTVSCNVYFVMLGLAQNWNVSYNSSNIFPAYRAEAAKRNQLYGCDAGKNVTEANLPY